MEYLGKTGIIELPQHRQCNLVGSSGLIVQIILGFFSFSILIFKRQKEYPPRPLKIWFLDSSKQVFSTMFIHIINVIFSLFLSEKRAKIIIKNQAGPDECNFYLVTFLIDTTIGLFLTLTVLQKLESYFKQHGFESFKSGNYYVTSSIKKITILHATDDFKNIQVPIEVVEIIEIFYVVWFIQVYIWITIIFINKMILFYLQYLFFTQLGWLSYYAIICLQPFPFIKLIFVMMIVPTIMNMIQFWISDNFLKKKVFTQDIEEIEEVEDDVNIQDQSEFNQEDEQPNFDYSNIQPELDQQNGNQQNSNNNNNEAYEQSCNMSQTSRTIQILHNTYNNSNNQNSNNPSPLKRSERVSVQNKKSKRNSKDNIKLKNSLQAEVVDNQIEDIPVQQFQLDENYQIASVALSQKINQNPNKDQNNNMKQISIFQGAEQDKSRIIINNNQNNLSNYLKAAQNNVNQEKILNNNTVSLNNNNIDSSLNVFSYNQFRKHPKQNITKFIVPYFNQQYQQFN